MGKNPRNSSVWFIGDENKEEKMKKTMKDRREREKVRALKGLSQLAEIFIRHLYAKGYFKEASFVEDNKLDFVTLRIVMAGILSSFLLTILVKIIKILQNGCWEVT